ncbi:MAG: 16S rRNA (guanine(966)-N(2))-methyltransferase RsmD [Halieaceae bacterium]|nr:16S rRNA (guanine(966)-N(2))-methyltransferase RsmD [Halieaceae bacterium]
MAKKQTGRKTAPRIIGGRWRGRKLPFEAAEGLRPTPDRVRETLFNWLAPQLEGAHCLDLFTGSGALGLEALSRGARSCILLDISRAVVASISQLLSVLGAEGGDCRQGDAGEFLQSEHHGRGNIDIVFLDPPFQLQKLEPLCTLLEENQWLAGKALIYLESSVREPQPQVPSNWRLYRGKRAGEVRYQLFVRA